ncbi:hypothetical protein BKA83DRAFT_4125415 [Pisolithus microcarpus]|nr:hypothetical protein BKA83DRAFT_4125415 [Pisolithus microcarpus]
MFWVCRWVVLEALFWLKENNPKYYGDVEISVSCIEGLLEDNIPGEIMSIIQQSDDVRIIKQVSNGYISLDDDEGDSEPDVVPLQVSGMIDTDMSKLTASKLVAWANLWKEGKEGGYGIWHSHQPVNDFGHPQAGGQADENLPNFFNVCAVSFEMADVKTVEGGASWQEDALQDLTWVLEANFLLDLKLKPQLRKNSVDSVGKNMVWDYSCFEKTLFPRGQLRIDIAHKPFKLSAKFQLIWLPGRCRALQLFGYAQGKLISEDFAWVIVHMHYVCHLTPMEISHVTLLSVHAIHNLLEHYH